MAETAEDVEELLFFDTFSHEVNEDLNLDLVQFPKPVYITEVRIIPLGARVQADFPGGVRLGATNPSTFHIEFFVNDMGKPGASTFEYLGDFDYNQNDCIHLECYHKDENIRQIPTDGLVLRGWYTTITLAVYGKLTKGITEPITSPPVAEIIQPIVVPAATVPLVPPVLLIAAANEKIVEEVVVVRKDFGYAETTAGYDDDFVPVVAQPVLAAPYSPKESRHIRPTTADREMSSESDWDRDDVPVTVAVQPPPPPPPPVTRRRDDDQIGATASSRSVRATSREISRTRERATAATAVGYSRSSSRERDYHNRGKRDWSSRSPDYRHSSSRRTRTASYGNKREKSREHDRRSPPDSHHEKRPRTPPMVSSPRRQPRTPEPTTKSTASKSSNNEHRSSSSSNNSKYEKGQPIRVIDHLDATDDHRIKSPPLPPPARLPTPTAPTAPEIVDETTEIDEPQPQAEPFEPILSDEEIGDEPDTQQFDIDDDDINDFDDVLKPFHPVDAVLENFHRGGADQSTDDKELELATKILHKINARDNLQDADDFQALPIEAKENWLLSAEHLIQVLHLIHNFTLAKRNATLTQLLQQNTDAIVAIVKIGLSFDCAMEQPQPGYKIRHIKIGARLAELLGCCNELVAVLRFRDKYDIFNELFELYGQKYMALSIKLMILKAVYSCLDSKVAMTYFLTVDDSEAGNGNKTTTVYQRLIRAIQENPQTRAKFALCSLMRKVNLYESLQLIREIVTKLFVMDNCENRSTDLQLLKVTMDEVLRAYTWDAISYTQPRRFLPASGKFEIVGDVAATKSAAFTFHAYFGIHALLETMLLLVANVNALPQNIVALCLDLIGALASSASGLDYLYGNIETTGVLVKCLLQSGSGGGVVDDVEAELEEDCDPETRSYRLGVEIAYKMKTRYYLDAVTHISDCDQLTDMLHSFYSLACSSAIGKRHVVRTIATEQHIANLIAVLDRERKLELSQPLPPPPPIASDIPLAPKLQSPIIGYVIDLLDMTIRCCDNLDYLHEHGMALMNLAKSPAALYDAQIQQQLQELAIYLKPLEIPNAFAYDDIQPLCELIKQSVDFIATFPGDLITAFRLIRHLAIDPHGTDAMDTVAAGSGGSTITSTTSSTIIATEAHHLQLRYKFVVLQLYSADGITMMANVLDKLTSHYEQPGLHTALLGAQQGVLTTQIVLPVVQVLRRMLSFVIHSRATNYKDLSVVEPLLKTYALLYHIPDGSAATPDALIAQSEIIATLLAYTQPTPVEGVDTESVHRSLWTQMIGELLKFILNGGPVTYMAGLLAVSELLPVPLPVYTMQPLLDTEVGRLVTERQLWSAHLHPNSAAVGELVQTLCTSCCSDLLHILARVCRQLADLAPNMALTVTKAVVELVLVESNHGSANMARLLELLGSLALRPAVKVALLSVLSGKLCDLLATLLAPMTMARVRSAAFRLVDILMDSDVAWPTDPVEQAVFNGMPTKDTLPTFVAAVVECFVTTKTDGDRLTAIALMERFVKIDYTLYLLRGQLDKKRSQLLTVLESFAAITSCPIAAPDDDDQNENAMVTENNDNEQPQPSPQTIEVVRSFLEMLKNAIVADGNVQRTLTLSANDLAAILSWKSVDSDQKHPLLELRSTGCYADELLDVVLTKLAESQDGEWQEIGEPLFGQADGIVQQFNGRPIYVLIDEYAEDVHSNYWACNGDEQPQENGAVVEQHEQVVCDLTELIKTCLPADVNVTGECKRLLHLSASPQSNRERTTTAPCFRTRRVEVEPTTGRPEKKIYVTRGRGFTRTPPSRGDLFRSRPPNTSRPPSLHVDDFLALETCGAQPTGPTGYNKLSREIINIRGTRGGRGGRGNFNSDRGGGGRLNSTSSPGVYRQSNRRTNSPSTWSHNNSGGSNDQSSGGQQHYRTATAEPVSGSHFQSNEYGSSSGGGGGGGSSGGGHFSSNTQQRGRMRGGSSRLPRTFNR